MKQLLFIFLLTIPFIAMGQDCNCESNFNWAKKTFEENDAGFAYALENKGEEAYKRHNESFYEKVLSITDPGECAETIFQWLTFFRSSHIGIRKLTQQQQASDAKASNEQEIIEKFKDWQTKKVNLNEFQEYLSSKKKHDIEGIWVSDPYGIGIKKFGKEYLGFIIKADGLYWREGQIKLKINEDGSAEFYMKDHSPRNFERAELMGKNYLEMGFVSLERKFPKLEDEPHIKRYNKALSAEKPYFEEIDENTAMLRIPSFSASERADIESIISENEERILKTPNLIIDLRNNGGGSDASYRKLLPFLYTNPIRTVGVEFWSTPLNNQRMLDFINDEEYNFPEEEKAWAKEAYDTLSNHIGEFVNLDTSVVSITTYDTIYPYPQNIGIIIHENNGSTTEQFLLAAKQSKKVKLFGTTTYGVLDISNVYFLKSPCEEFELGYCLTRSMRIPDMTIDEKGIQPDYYIAKDIPKYEWIKFVADRLNH